MNKLSPKIKIYISIVIWLLVSGILFGYVFPRIDQANQDQVTGFANARKNLDKVKAEQESYRLAKQDLENVTKEHIQPDGFFSKDVTLVNEIQTIENMADTYHVTVDLTGLSGTLQNSQKAPTRSQIFLVPYALVVHGGFTEVLNFLDNLEHVPFVTTINSVSMSIAAGDTVNLVLGANFYLKSK